MPALTATQVNLHLKSIPDWSKRVQMFDSRVMETEFLNRPDGDPALVAASYRFSDSIKTGVAPLWWAAAMILFCFRPRQKVANGHQVRTHRHRRPPQCRQIRAVQSTVGFYPMANDRPGH
jgi:hypothetical protein